MVENKTKVKTNKNKVSIFNPFIAIIDELEEESKENIVRKFKNRQRYFYS